MSDPPLRELRGARVTVMGLGLFGGGVAAVRYALGCGARVTLTDLRSAQVLAPALKQLKGADFELVLGEHRERDFEDAELIIANPAVPPRNRFLELARSAQVPITSEVALFLDAVQAPVVAISGTQGKSSTTHMLAQLLGAGGRRVHLGGNIGRPLLGDLGEIAPEDICALELSSYQLEQLPQQWKRERDDSPLLAAALTNIHSDHLERHGTRAAYARAKLQLFDLLRVGGTGILPAEPLPVEWNAPRDLHLHVAGAGPLRIADGEFRMGDARLGSLSECPFAAPFQRDNVLLALGLAHLAGVDEHALRAALPNLRGLPHRLDPIGELGGRPLWDNLVSTTPDSTVSALEALPAGQIVLLGGRVKDLALEPLMAALRATQALPVLFGEALTQWTEPFGQAEIAFHGAPGVLEALDLALKLEGAGILISPACSSFDAFPNFQVRADAVLAHADALGLRRRVFSG